MGGVLLLLYLAGYKEPASGPASVISDLAQTVEPGRGGKP